MSSLGARVRRPGRLALVVVLLWLIGAFMVVPAVEVLRTVFLDEQGALTIRAIERLASSDRAMSSLGNSLLLAAALSVTANVVGVFVVLVTRYFQVPGSRVLWLGFASTLVFGGIVQASAYRLLTGETGILTVLLRGIWPELGGDWFQGFAAVLLVMTIASTGLHLLFLGPILAKLDFQMIEAATLMGASTATVLWRIVLPMLRPMIFAITILTFLGGLSALAAPQVLGGDFQTITPMILTFATTPASRDLAATLAIVLGLATVLLLTVLTRVERGGVFFSVAKVSTALQRQRIRNPLTNVVVQSAAWLLWLAYVTPPALAVVFSFADGRAIATGTLDAASLTLDNYLRVLTDPTASAPLLTSIGYGAVASVVVVALMLPAAHMLAQGRSRALRALEYLLHIPWVLPATLLALGLILAYQRPAWQVGGQVLTGTVAVLGIAYVVAKTPFTVRLLKAAFLGVPDHVEEAATLLGASAFRTFRSVLLPLVLPTTAAVLALNFTSLLDDYDSAVFLANPFFPPLGIVIRNATTGQTLQDATALVFVYAVLLMVISALAMWLVYGGGIRRWRRSA